jgi:hypothetical protein
VKRLLLLALVACTGTAAPHSRAQRIGKLEEAIGGPHAIGRPGDFILENDQVRFVIADKGVGRVNTTFGGSLVDADLQRVQGDGKGNDQLAELLPGFVFTVIDPTDVCVPTKSGKCPAAGSTEPLMDGSDGGPAAVLVTGSAGDLFQMVALLNTGLVQPAQLQLSQLYKLEPGKRYLTIETTIKNTSSGAHPFPYLDPTQLGDLFQGFIPNLPSLQLSAPLGQLPLFGGEQSIFTPGAAGFNVEFAIQDTYNMVGGFPGFPGMIVDYVATRGKGVSYGLAVPDSDDNYANTYASQYPGQTVTAHSMLLPFTYAGVTGAYMYEPPATMQANEERTYTSYFVVGRGDVASVYDTILETRKTATGVFAGRVIDQRSQAPVTGASVIVLDRQGNPLDQAETDAHGAFLAHLPAGDYAYTVVTDDRTPSAPVNFSIVAGEITGVGQVEVAPPGTIAVSVTDDEGRHAPVKIQLLGHDSRLGPGVDPRGLIYSLRLGEHIRPTAFDGSDQYIENAWWTVDGRLQAQVKPGTYDLVITRGPEFEITKQTITVKSGELAEVQTHLTRAYTSDGWIAGDFHIHSQPSTDSGLPIDQRVASCAAEGLEVAVATDHNYVTDYAPVIASTGLDPWLLGIPGMELTTFEMGHFNGYPLKVDPGSTRGGEFVWQKQPPAKLFAQLRALAIDPDDSIVQVNHPRQAVLGYFAQFFVDPATAEPYTPTGLMGLFAPYGDEFAASNFSYDFDAIELITGRRIEDVHTYKAPNPLPPGPFPDPQPTAGQVVVGKDGRALYPGVVETWMTMLDRGHKATGMGTSDSHHMLGDEPGYARTLVFVGHGKDVPGGFSRQDVIDAIKGHHAIATNAPFIDMHVGTAMIGDTVVQSGPVNVKITVDSPSWAKANHLIVYASGGQIIADMPITGTHFDTTVTFTPAKDSWVVAEVTGTDNMFPVLTPTEFPPLDATIIINALTQGLNGLDLASLPIANPIKPVRVHTSTPYAITNPIWIDVDGNGWTPPGPPLPMRRTAPSARPDVRQQFDALPDVSR